MEDQEYENPQDRSDRAIPMLGSLSKVLGGTDSVHVTEASQSGHFRPFDVYLFSGLLD